MIVIDGNDGIGKSTICASLRTMGYEVADRGLPTKATDNPNLERTRSQNDLYVILDAPVEVSRERLAKAGKDMNEHWHLVETLKHYRQRFKEVAAAFGVPLIDASGTQAETLAKVKGHLGIAHDLPRVGVPKGRLFEHAQSWMRRSGYEMETTGRNYRPKCCGLDAFILKPRSLPQMVALGLLDSAICGIDIVLESPYSDVLDAKVAMLYPEVSLMVAAVSREILDNPPPRPLVIATEFPAIADRWATSRNLAHVCINTYGSTEAYAPAFADLVLDVVETGQTLKDNGLVIIDHEVMVSTPVAIIRKDSVMRHHKFLMSLGRTT